MDRSSFDAVCESYHDLWIQRLKERNIHSEKREGEELMQPFHLLSEKNKQGVREMVADVIAAHEVEEKGRVLQGTKRILEETHQEAKQPEPPEPPKGRSKH